MSETLPAYPVSCLSEAAIPSGGPLGGTVAHTHTPLLNSPCGHQMSLEQVLQPQIDQLKALLFGIPGSVLLTVSEAGQACLLLSGSSTKSGVKHS